jgi:hypothetical protein
MSSPKKGTVSIKLTQPSSLLFSSSFLSYILSTRTFPYSSPKVLPSVSLKNLAFESFPSAAYEDSPFMRNFKTMIDSVGL